jgi:hypothetical protein
LGISQSNEGQVEVKYASNTYRSSTTLALNEWSHILLVLTTQGSKLFINGVLDLEIKDKYSHTGSKAYLKIGANDIGAEIFQGEIEQLVFWKSTNLNPEKRVFNQIELKEETDIVALFRKNEYAPMLLPEKQIDVNSNIFLGDKQQFLHLNSITHEGKVVVGAMDS